MKRYEEFSGRRYGAIIIWDELLRVNAFLMIKLVIGVTEQLTVTLTELPGLLSGSQEVLTVTSEDLIPIACCLTYCLMLSEVAGDVL